MSIVTNGTPSKFETTEFMPSATNMGSLISTNKPSFILKNDQEIQNETMPSFLKHEVVRVPVDRR